MAWFSGPDFPSRHHSPSRHSSSRYSSTSHYRRRSRDGYINRIIHLIKRVVRDFYGYARQHPVKVFMLVVMPLITGGALTNILRKFGLRLPAGLSKIMGGFEGGRGGFGGGRREGFGGGEGGGIQSVMKLAQMFI